MTRKLKLEVFVTRNGIVTVTTDMGGGSGTRLCGIKLYASGSRKVAEFYLDESAVEAIVEDFGALPKENA